MPKLTHKNFTKSQFRFVLKMIVAAGIDRIETCEDEGAVNNPHIQGYIHGVQEAVAMSIAILSAQLVNDSFPSGEVLESLGDFANIDETNWRNVSEDACVKAFLKNWKDIFKDKFK